MLGAYLSIKTNSLTGRNISLFTDFDSHSPLKKTGVFKLSEGNVIITRCSFYHSPGHFRSDSVIADQVFPRHESI